MKYDKPPLSFEAQADLILSRGLMADRASLVSRLQSVNYYRLSGYLYPYREPDGNFKRGTTLEIVWKHYLFDRKLRFVAMDAIERAEVAIRTLLAYHFSHEIGPFAYTDRENLPHIRPESHALWLSELKAESKRSAELFMAHFNLRYGDAHELPPLWMLIEIMSFGKMFVLFRGSPVKIQKLVAAHFGIEDKVLKSWLFSLNVVRNICAHHGRLWNTVLDTSTLLPSSRKNPQWESIEQLPRGRVFIMLTILRHLLRAAAPSSHWTERVTGLLDEHPEISLASMGFPDDWRTHPLWG